MAHIIDIDKLNTEERLKLANYLWDSIEDSKTELDISDWHKDIIDKRIENRTEDTSKLKPWDTLYFDITKKHNL
jgi:putative addiction module component (TIGR02574 family)